MDLKTNIENKYKEAIKAKNTDEVNALRLIKSAIKDKEIAIRTSEKLNEIGELEILSLLQTLIKQRKDSIDSFQKASRDDLIAIEKKEIDIISQFLPKQLNEADTEKIIDEIITLKKLASIKDMGNLMNELKSNYAGSIDMALAGKIAKSKFVN